MAEALGILAYRESHEAGTAVAEREAVPLAFVPTLRVADVALVISRAI
jgi:hypothetical protein